MPPTNFEPSKTCEVCGRVITWRKKWEKNWAEVKYCGEKCRRNKKTTASGFEERILELLHSRGSALTVCPSEILPADQKKQKPLMEEVRQAARRLVHLGKIEILQGRKVVSPSDFKGPIRLRLKR